MTCVTKDPTGESAAFSLKELDRRSFCCHAGVEHVHPLDARPFQRCEMLRCAACKRHITKFQVVNEDGVVLWPVPRGYPGDFRPSRRGLCISSGQYYEISLPRKVRKRVFR